MFESIESLTLYLTEEKGLNDLSVFQNVIHFKREVKRDLYKTGTPFNKANKVFKRILNCKKQNSQKYIDLLDEFLKYSPLDAFVTFEKYITEYNLEESINIEKAINGENDDIQKFYSLLEKIHKPKVEDPSIRYEKFVKKLKEIAYNDHLRFDSNGNEHKLDEFYSGRMYLNALAIHYSLLDDYFGGDYDEEIYQDKIGILDEIDKNQGEFPHFYVKYERLLTAYKADQYFAFNEGVRKLSDDTAIDYLYKNYPKITVDFDDDFIKEMIRRNIYFPFVFLNELNFHDRFIPIYDYEEYNFNEAKQMCNFLKYVGKENNVDYLNIRKELIDHLPNSFIDTIGNYVYYDDNLIYILKYISDNKFYSFTYEEFYNVMTKDKEINYHELLDILMKLKVLYKFNGNKFIVSKEAYQLLSSDKKNYQSAIESSKAFCEHFKVELSSFTDNLPFIFDEDDKSKFKA